MMTSLVLTLSTTQVCSTTGATTISASNQASSLGAACRTFTGDIVLPTLPVFNPSDNVGYISIDGLHEIQGSFKASNTSDLTRLGAPELSTVTGDFVLEGLINTTSTDTEFIITFPSLALVGGSFRLNENGITDLSYLNLNNLYRVGQDLNITYNHLLDSISLTSLTEVGGSVVFYGNGNHLSVSIDLPSLTHIGKNLLIYNNTWGNATFNLNELTTVNSSVGIDGNFASFEFPLLSHVGYNFNVNSSANATCDTLESLFDSGAIKDKFTCDTLISTITGPAQSAPSGFPDGAKVGIGVGVALMAAAAALIGFLLLRRKRERKQQKEEENEQQAAAAIAAAGPVKTTVDPYGKMELPSDSYYNELPSEERGEERHELLAEHGHSEIEEQKKILGFEEAFEVEGSICEGGEDVRVQRNDSP